MINSRQTQRFAAMMCIYSINKVFQEDLLILLTHKASSQSTRCIKSIKKGTIAVRNPDNIVPNANNMRYCRYHFCLIKQNIIQQYTTESPINSTSNETRPIFSIVLVDRPRAISWTMKIVNPRKQLQSPRRIEAMYLCKLSEKFLHIK